MDGFQEWYTYAALIIARVIESIGIVVLVLGVGSTFVRYLRSRFLAGGQLQESFRSALGKDILLGLEFLVAADIIGTVAVHPSYQSLGVLGLLVLIRTFLSFSLEIEIEGHFPWRKTEHELRRLQAENARLAQQAAARETA